MYRFGSHHSSFKSLKISSDRKCVSVKEEGNYSHVNQAYESLTAASNKKFTVESLLLMRRHKYQGRGVVDQCSLVHVGFHTIWNTNSAICIGPFNRVNLHPQHRLSFIYWWQNNSVLLFGVQTFKEETHVDTYTLLPLFWHGMEPAEKRGPRKKWTNMMVSVLIASWHWSLSALSFEQIFIVCGSAMRLS